MKKIKWPKTCYYCKYYLKCKDTFKVTVCNKFKFNSTSKSI